MCIVTYSLLIVRSVADEEKHILASIKMYIIGRLGKVQDLFI